MKKTALIVAMAMVGFANAAPAPETAYIGANVGLGQAHDGLNQFKNGAMDVNGNLAKGHKTKNSLTGGVFAGYQITDHFAVEGGYDYDGQYKARDGMNNKFKHVAHGMHVSLKASYPVIEDLDVYGRAGAKVLRSHYSTTEGDVHTKATRWETSPVFAAGVEYAITPNLAARAEYEWVNNVGSSRRAFNDAPFEYQPDIGKFNFGISYRFGSAPAVVEPVKEPEMISKTFAFNSDVLFDFDKAGLKPAGQKAIDDMQAEIARVDMKGHKYQVNGYTDRLGSDAYNVKLSQKRAETVANYLVEHGVAVENIGATGFGKTHPVTGNKCDAVKGRKALIECLSPDRRVEVEVKGTKTITEVKQ